MVMYQQQKKYTSRFIKVDVDSFNEVQDESIDDKL